MSYNIFKPEIIYSESLERPVKATEIKLSS